MVISVVAEMQEMISILLNLLDIKDRKRIIKDESTELSAHLYDVMKQIAGDIMQFGNGEQHSIHFVKQRNELQHIIQQEILIIDIRYQLDVSLNRMLNDDEAEIIEEDSFTSHYQPLRICKKSNTNNSNVLSVRYAGMFTNSHHFAIHGGRFLEITNGMDGIQYLAQSIASDAKHNSGQRFQPPKCHPGTRKSIIQLLTYWVLDESSPSKIVWLNGATGTGKSAIAQTLCEKLEKMNLLGASFFFSKMESRNNNVQRLFTTIAYQLAVSLPLPTFRELLKKQLNHDPDIVHQTMELQWFKLIVAPFRAAIEEDGGCMEPMAIIIDGLDECQEAAQVRTINLITTASVYGLPLRFIFSSHPGLHLQDAFSEAIKNNLAFEVELSHSREVDRDIRLFLQHEFNVIRTSRKYADTMRCHTSWPSYEHIEKIVSKASGRFGYAASVLKYVQEHSTDPVEQLEIALQLPDTVVAEEPRRDV
ncbi:hypothetical protein BDQ17DRAFT_1329623 [Cyathus striatus]|nr:hypothetical protein BDQ17DRAFT_1329623 [Cyathus striatus]